MYPWFYIGVLKAKRRITLTLINKLLLYWKTFTNRYLLRNKTTQLFSVFKAFYLSVQAKDPSGPLDQSL